MLFHLKTVSKKWNGPIVTENQKMWFYINKYNKRIGISDWFQKFKIREIECYPQLIKKKLFEK